MTTLPYQQFAAIYDDVMSIDYKPWKYFIEQAYLYNTGKYPDSLLDLGCGTGGLTRLFDYPRKTGMDISFPMLAEARRLDRFTEYLEGDIRNFSLGETFDLVISTHDVINYITDEKELVSAFQCIRDHLAPNGQFFMDITSEYNILRHFDEKYLQETHQGITLHWDNRYNRSTGILSSRIEFHGSGKEITEIHKQRYYSPETISQLLEKAGLRVFQTGSDYKRWKPGKNAALINFACKAV